jgi:hypothetical protein
MSSHRVDFGVVHLSWNDRDPGTEPHPCMGSCQTAGLMVKDLEEKDRIVGNKSWVGKDLST